MKNILLVEDDIAIVDVYKMALEAKGFGVDVVTLGKEAIEKMDMLEKGEGQKPDLVLLDIVLPDMNGMDILKEMRERSASKNIPVFVLTNYSDKDLEEKGKELKAEKFILKAGCSPSKLVEMAEERLKA